MNTVNIIVKDDDSKVFIEDRLNETNQAGNVTIYVP